MDATPWLAGIAGGAAAVDQAQHDDEAKKLAYAKLSQNEELTQAKLRVQQLLGQLKSDTSKANTDTTAKSRETIANLNDVGRTTRSTTRDTTTRRGQDMRSADTQRGQDLGDTHYWDTASRFYDQLFTNDATRRRGQDVSAETSRYGTDTRSEDSGNTLRARNALGVLALRARKKPSLFDNTPPEDFAGEFDRLYNQPEQAGSEALDAGGDTTPAPRAAAPTSAAPMPGARPAPPVAPRPAPAGAAPAAPAIPQGLKPGAVVTLKGGKKVTVTTVNPDGTFEYR